jgi:hypothetical protein
MTTLQVLHAHTEEITIALAQRNRLVLTYELSCRCLPGPLQFVHERVRWDVLEWTLCTLQHWRLQQQCACRFRPADSCFKHGYARVTASLFPCQNVLFAGLEQDGLMSIIGYGSLLSETSSQFTFPDLCNFRVARLKGFRRVFAHVSPFFIQRCVPAHQLLLSLFIKHLHYHSN